METLKYLWAQAKASWTIIWAKIMLGVAAVGAVIGELGILFGDPDLKQQIQDLFAQLGISPKALAIIAAITILARIRGFLTGK